MLKLWKIKQTLYYHASINVFEIKLWNFARFQMFKKFWIYIYICRFFYHLMPMVHKPVKFIIACHLSDFNHLADDSCDWVMDDSIGHKKGSHSNHFDKLFNDSKFKVDRAECKHSKAQSLRFCCIRFSLANYDHYMRSIGAIECLEMVFK